MFVFVQNIDPVLVSVGSIQIRYYGIFFSLAFLTAYFITRYYSRLKGYPDKILETIIFWGLIGLVVFAHWVHILFYEPMSIINNPIRILEFGVGLASHGGLLGITLVVFIYTRIKKLNFLEWCDIITTGGVAFIPFVRLGNFFNSEIYGRVTNLPIGTIFKQRGEDVPRHPSQLYEMAIGLFILLMVNIIYKKYYKRIKPGALFFGFMIFYFITRFLVEYVKEYQGLSPSFPFTEGQLLSAPIVVGTLIYFIKQKYWQLLPEEAIAKKGKKGK